MRFYFKKKIIGELVDNIFIKKVREKQHLFRVLDAWGIDASVFRNYLLPNNAKIKIFDMENGKVYITDAKTYKEKGQYYHFKKAGHDYSPQIFLSRKYFQVK